MVKQPVGQTQFIEAWEVTVLEITDVFRNPDFAENEMTRRLFRPCVALRIAP
jgi:hypothetical protein